MYDFKTLCKIGACDSCCSIVPTTFGQLIVIWHILWKTKIVYDSCTQKCGLVKLCLWLISEYLANYSCALSTYTAYDTFGAKRNMCIIFKRKCILMVGACDSCCNIVLTTVVQLVAIIMTHFLKSLICVIFLHTEMFFR